MHGGIPSGVPLFRMCIWGITLPWILQPAGIRPTRLVPIIETKIDERDPVVAAAIIDR